ncbi:MAG: replication protein [Lachnospiraceae bacterium]|nr:replication protein [Lachnospiraceae bacterium]
MKRENASIRYRNFASVVYPESAPEDWIEVLSDFHVPIFISPLHDSDVNPTGEVKKAHYHIMLMFEGKKSKEQVKELLDAVNAVGLESVNTIRGYARYLCHLDNPEKAQYKIDDVRALSGADYMGVIGLAVDKYKALREMQDFCRDNNVFSFADLADYCAMNRFDWYRVLCDCGAFFMRTYLRSLERYYYNSFQIESSKEEDV